ncbi:DUF1284 domain-containing protein [Geoglobus acetivorans]|uniref:Iron-sulfur binding protein n=1 Tax=Geoglobus acetivorans TaxID=565033 RepID=A0A0A7GGC5_GEOAI|nr:Iron-sulfur binding protein [Geoglobus acetivorans]
MNNLFRILKEDQISVIFGADDVCTRCPHLEDGLCNYEENAEEHIVELDQMAYRLLNVFPGMEISWKDVKNRLPEIMGAWKKFACENCDWRRVCESDDEWNSY